MDPAIAFHGFVHPVKAIDSRKKKHQLYLPQTTAPPAWLHARAMHATRSKWLSRWLVLRLANLSPLVVVAGCNGGPTIPISTRIGAWWCTCACKYITKLAIFFQYVRHLYIIVCAQYKCYDFCSCSNSHIIFYIIAPVIPRAK
jgi:hypothetical protein